MPKSFESFFGDGDDMLTAEGSDFITLAAGDGPDATISTPLPTEVPNPMDRAQMIEALAALGFDVSQITDAVPDNVLAEMLRAIEANAPAAEAPAAPAPEAAAMDEEAPPEEEEEKEPEQEAMQYDDGAMPTREEMIAALTELGMDPAALQAMDDATLLQTFEEALAALQAQAAPEAAAPEPAAPMSEARRFSESDANFIRSVVAQAVQETFKEVNSKIEGGLKQIREFGQNTKRANVQKFCESLIASGQLLPAERPATVARLMRAGTSQVHKFSDKKTGKVRVLSELDLQMQELRRRPKLAIFHEKLAQPLGQQPGSEASEVRKVESHFEKFSETFAKHGTTKDKYVKGFKAIRARNPKATAEQYISNEIR